MANCLYSDVRLIIDTGLTDANLTSLIVLADQEIFVRGFRGYPWTSDLLKQLSMYLTASLAAMNDVRSTGKAEYRAGLVPSGSVTRLTTSLPQYYRQIAEDLVQRVTAGLPRARTG